MFKSFSGLSRKKRILLIIASFLLIVPAGAVVGGFLGLIATTFVPLCCDESGCRSCLEFRGMVGYEAAGFIGFFLGAFSALVLYASFLVYKNKK